MKRKAAIVIIICALLGGLAVSYRLQLAREQAGRDYSHDNLIRLHIIANSNDPPDQALKYKVRDAIIAALSPELLKLHSRTEAEALVASEQDRIVNIAEQAVLAGGYSYPARVELGDFAFPTRTYGDLVLPAGTYRAVRVVLGKGAGANWWCVLYPPLCFVNAASSGITTSEDGVNMSKALAAVKQDLTQGGPQEGFSPVAAGGVRLRMRLLEWLQSKSVQVARLFDS